MPGPGDETQREKAFRLLDERKVLTLAVTDREGLWAADVYYVRDGTDLCFFSSPESRHVLAAPAAAGTVHAEAKGWRDIRGIQMSGRIEEARPGPERERQIRAYRAKFPFAGAILDSALESGRVRLHRFRPARMLYVDNEVEFGTRIDIPLP